MKSFETKKTHLSADQYLDALVKVQKGGLEALATLSEVSIAALAGWGASASAGALYAALGFTTTTTIPVTVFGSTTLASWLGIAGTTVIVATPVGWTIGVGLAGGAIAYGVIRFFRFAGGHAERKRRLQEDITLKLKEHLKKGNNNDDATIKVISDALISGYFQKKIPPQYGSRILEMMREGSMAPALALDSILQLLSTSVSPTSNQLSIKEARLMKNLASRDESVKTMILGLLQKGDLTIDKALEMSERLKQNSR